MVTLYARTFLLSTEKLYRKGGPAWNWEETLSFTCFSDSQAL
jgi:hypothetical protein